MAYDETSFLSGIALGRAMKGISMANPNRGGSPHVVSGRLAAVRRIPLRPGAAAGPLGGSAAVSAWNLSLFGQHIRAALLPPGDPGFGGIAVVAELTAEEERITAAAAMSGELTGSIGASLCRKAADRSLQAESVPNGMGGIVLAAGTINAEN